MERTRFLWLPFLIVVLVNLGILATDTGVIDPYFRQPRILLQDGHFIIKAAPKRNVIVGGEGSGTVLIKALDIPRIFNSFYNRNEPVSSVSLPAWAHSPFAIRFSKLTDLLMNAHSVPELETKWNQLEENITDVTNRVNQLEGTGQDRISNRSLRRVMAKVFTLTEKVNRLTQLLSENECTSNPCRNGGTCVDAYGGFLCNCPSNWEGVTCETDVNECAVYAGTSLGCQNGATCVNTPGGYRCDCPSNYYGIHCSETHDDCSSGSHTELCGHGTCVNEKRVQPGQPKYRCICDSGWKNSRRTGMCTEDIDECQEADVRCSVNPLVICLNIPGGYICGPCPPGYTGSGRRCSDINECEYQNGGCSMQPFVQCTNTLGSRTCGPCPPGYMGNGVQCNFVGVCSINRGGCHPMASCLENSAITGTYRECRCPPGYVGNGEGLNGCVRSQGMSCANNPCVHGTCQVLGQSFHCVCEAGYFGTLCNQQTNLCLSSPCQNGGTCSVVDGGFVCACTREFTGPTCQEGIASCGGYLTGDNGTLQFPLGQLLYKHDQSCAWVITVNETKVIKVEFSRFQLEAGHNCANDFLQLHDGPTSASRVIGRFCDVNLHGEIFNTTHNQLYLWFRSDKTVSRAGFTLEWEAVDPNCGGYLNSSEYGAINSPGYPGMYPKNRNCRWIVQVPIGKRIQFHFATLSLQTHENCSLDYLKVFDGLLMTDPLLGTFCSTTTPAPLLTSGHTATLYFNSDSSIQSTGFHITYSSVPGIEGCGGTLTSAEGRLNSPNFPDVYENNLSCEWLIRIHPDNRLRLKFTEFSLESHTDCRFDSVEVFDGSSDAAPLLGRYCGEVVPQELLSNSNMLYIRFRTDSTIRRKGFKAEYKTICGGVFTELTGVLQSPYYPDPYPPRATCIYEIRLPQGFLVNLTIQNMDIEIHPRCRFDYIEIRDGDSENSPELVSRLCGYFVPESIVSTYNYLWMKFVTDQTQHNQGFYAVYEAIDMGCGGVLTSESGQISSPRHPDMYPHSVSCSWLIRAPSEFLIRLSFTAFVLERHINCSYDYVVVEDTDGVVIGRYCGARIPPTLLSVGNSLIVKFVADSSISREGFTANYEFVDSRQSCGGEIHRSSGVLRSPGYPNPYPHSAKCIWLIHALEGRQITLNVTNFNLEVHSDCNFDYLEIRNGAYMTSPLLGKFCGTTIPSTIRSHSNIIRLELKTDRSMSAPGFEMYYDNTATGCGGLLTSPGGSIVSPNYPQAYPSNAVCEWLIRVNHGSVISVTFVNIDIEQHRNCLYDYVEIFDGETTNSVSLTRMCNHQQNPGAITSSGNTLLVVFRSDASTSAGGFHLTYQAVCRSEFTQRRGVIESPNFPNTYPRNQNCVWVIRAPKGNNISLAFSHFTLEGGDSCESDYVEISEVKNLQPVPLSKYCGSLTTLPAPITTSTNVAVVKLVTDHSITREGFRLEWQVKGCGGDIRDKSDVTISSPNYPNGYPFDVECIWHIWYPPGFRVELTIHELDMEAANECEYDYLRVYGGEDANAPRLLNICSRVTQDQAVSTHGNQMTIEFHSDHSMAGKGFAASVRKLEGGCGGTFSTEEGTIMSPNYPNPYSFNDDCEWVITVRAGHTVVLDFYDLHLPTGANCSKGYVAVHDGNSSSSKLKLITCGDEKPEAPITSTGNQMYIEFAADGVNVGNGFRAHYHQGCGSRLLADESGEISSPKFLDAVSTNMNCSWILYTSPGEKVVLTVTFLHMGDSENCSESSLIIKDGDLDNSPIISEICGHHMPPPIVSRGSVMTVFFRNTGMFRATYGVASTHCGGELTGYSGNIASPGFPNFYDFDVECVWIIKASSGSKLLLSFSSFNLEESEHCNVDYVEVRESNESGPFLGRFCGSSIPANIPARTTLWIKFRTDDQGTDRGFMAHYELQHETQLNGTSGEIASPAYPMLIQKQDMYLWTVTVPNHMAVSARFQEISITQIATDMLCNAGVQFFDGVDELASDLGYYCGYRIPEPIISSGNTMTIRYIGSKSYPSRFLLQWTAVSPSGVVVLPPIGEGSSCWSGISLNVSSEANVTSPNYPLDYPNEAYCTYIVRAPVEQHVELTINDLLMEGGRSDDCSFDKVEVYYVQNSNTNQWILNNTFCGRLSNVQQSSPSNLMKLVFQSDGTIRMKGFHATAHSKCGSRITGTSGVLNSSTIHPILDSLRRYQSFQCEWIISVRQRRTIQVTFDDFNIESDGVCNTNYIMLRNGGSVLSPPLGNGKYCGTNRPVAALETSSNELYVQVAFVQGTLRPPIFTLRYTEMSLGCGGQIYLTHDRAYVEISSPNYPSPPSHELECQWVIVSPAGTRMRMDFENEFHMTPNCLDEYLELFDGGTEVAPVLHRFCGHNQPSSVMTTGSALLVYYVTAVDEPEAGFKGTVRIAQCGGTINSYYDVLTSPNYPQNYGSSVECEWFLRMRMGYHIVLNITDLDTPPAADCRDTDYIEIRDTDAQGEVIATLCGSRGNRSLVFNIPGPQAYVKFKSNSANTAKGFSMIMDGNFDDGCGGMVEGPTGVITSPNYPNALSGSRDCFWRLEAPEGRRIKINFNAFNLPRDESTGTCISYLKIYNVTFWRRSRETPPKLCGSTAPEEIDSASGNLNVALFHNGFNAGEGFSFTYTTDEPSICGGLLPLPSGNISTPIFQAAGSDSYVDCRWKMVDDENFNKTIVFKFDLLDLPGIMANYCMDGGLYITGLKRYYLARYCGNYTSPVLVTSPFGSTTLRIVANLSTTVRGIRGTYNVSNCGGVLDGTNATIFSPGYPDGYPPNTDCHWLFNVPEGEEIQLTTVDMRLESDCSKDYVLVREGYHITSPIVGKFCGTVNPIPIVSNSKVLTVIFHSDAYGTAPGFKMSTKELQRGCGGLIHMSQGSLSSPGYPSRYANNVECKWTIEQVPGYLIRLEFVGRFDIENDPTCGKDYVQIFNYMEDVDTWIVGPKLCGVSTPAPIISLSSKMRVIFRTNDRINGDGFLVKFNSICGGNFTAKEGRVFSPSYPGFYENNLLCTYRIGKSGQYISLTFDEYFSIEGNSNCIFDYVEISHEVENGSLVHGSYCGTEVPAARVVPGPVTIRFVTDASYTAHGFSLNYKVLEGNTGSLPIASFGFSDSGKQDSIFFLYCGGILTAPEGTIKKAPTQNEYFNEVKCVWEIRAPPNKVVSVRISSLNIALSYRCWNSYLEIVDGNRTGSSIGRICGSKLPPVIKSTGPNLTLALFSRERELRVDSSLSKFAPLELSAVYYTTYGPQQGCGGILNQSFGEISSLDANFDGLYEPNLDCSWTLIGNDSNKVFQLEFLRFDLEDGRENDSCIFDYIEVRDGLSPDSPFIGRYCGSTKPSPISSSTNKLFISFHTNEDINNAGFKIRFTAITSACGPSLIITAPNSNEIDSPNYPNGLPPNLRCRWTFVRNMSSTTWFREMVSLFLIDLDFDCNGDYIEFQRQSSYVMPGWESHTRNNNPPIRICGAVHPHEISGYSGLTLTLHSDAIRSGGRGFKIVYMNAACGRAYTRDHGAITNQAYPGYMNSDASCQYLIQAATGKTISLYFRKFEMIFIEQECNSLKIYDGANTSSPLIGSYCGYAAPNPIFSNGTSLFIDFNMKDRIGMYYISYTMTDQGRGCGGRIEGESGALSSPLFPLPWTGECIWQLAVPGYHTIRITFKEFHLNSTAGCDTNYVELYEGITDDIANRIVRYCGSDYPGVHNSAGNEVLVKFVTDDTNTAPGFLIYFDSNPYAPDPSMSIIQKFPEGRRQEKIGDVLYLNP